VKVVVPDPMDLHDHPMQQMMPLLHMDCGHSKLSLLEGGQYFKRNVEFGIWSISPSGRMWCLTISCKHSWHA